MMMDGNVQWTIGIATTITQYDHGITLPQFFQGHIDPDLDVSQILNVVVVVILKQGIKIVLNVFDFGMIGSDTIADQTIGGG